MNKTELVYMDAKSSKFWNIELNGDSHTVTYGRIGTDGHHAVGCRGQRGDVPGRDLTHPPATARPQRHPRRVDRDPLEPRLELVRFAQLADPPPRGISSSNAPRSP